MKKSELKKLIKEELNKVILNEASEFYKDTNVKGKAAIRGGLNITASMDVMEDDIIELEIDTYSSYPGPVFTTSVDNKKQVIEAIAKIKQEFEIFDSKVAKIVAKFKKKVK